MKQMRIAMMAVMMAGAATTSAQAMTVSNLDSKPHTVVFESTPGSILLRTLEPGDSTNVMQSGGEVYIQGGTLHLRPNANDVLVIWRDGNLQLQLRRKLGGDGIF